MLDRSSHSVSRLLIPVVLLVFATGCPPTEHHLGAIPDCQTDEDCPDGVCEEGECVAVACTTDDDCEDGICEDGTCTSLLEFQAACQNHEECNSGLCVEFEGEQSCTRECDTDQDCDGDWVCEDFADLGDVCRPASTPPPGDGSTICGAAGVSTSGDLELSHCLAPYDLGSETMSDGDKTLESGGFEIISE